MSRERSIELLSDTDPGPAPHGGREAPGGAAQWRRWAGIPADMIMCEILDAAALEPADAGWGGDRVARPWHARLDRRVSYRAIGTIALVRQIEPDIIKDRRGGFRRRAGERRNRPAVSGGHQRLPGLWRKAAGAGHRRRPPGLEAERWRPARITCKACCFRRRCWRARFLTSGRTSNRGAGLSREARLAALAGTYQRR